MRTKVRKWGNSLAVRIPRSFADEAGLSDGTAVRMRLSESGLSIEPVPIPPPSLEALLERITPENLHDEIDAEAPVGKEAW
ncbi:MAG: AbrB/MazE/SpoVT family DNA-binding domain-containing protein [Trueperaceae bacterium]